MIILDTNVISALMQSEADLDVVAWLDDQPSESLWTTTVTVFEVRFGIELLTPSKRRRQLDDAFTAVLADDLGGRVLPFDEPAARIGGSIAARGRKAGRPVDFRDLQIAGIVSARKGTLATGNTKHFAHAGITLVNPWS